MRIAAILVVPAILSIGLTAGSAELVGDGPVVTRTVVWGGKTFADADELSVWLAARGASYDRWAIRHPSAAARLEGRAARTPSPQPAVASPPDEPRSAKPPGRDAREAEPEEWRFPVLRAATAMLTAIGVGLIVAAASPAFLPAIRARRVAEHRAHLLAGGVSLLVGVAVGGLL